MSQHYEDDLIIEDKRKRRRIVSEETGETLVTAVYNPEDPVSYRKIMNIFMILDGKRSNPNDFDLTEEEQASIEEKLESTDDFDVAVTTFSKLNGAMQATMADIDSLIDGVNDLFGAGVCEVLLKYGENGEYLMKMLDVAFKEVNKSRQVVKDKYKSKKKSNVIE